MSDWTWEYVPDAINVVGGLTRAQIDEVESLALGCLTRQTDLCRFKACPQWLTAPQLRITIT